MFDKLEKNIQAVIAEQQMKLGYMQEKIRLYYPLESLNGLLERKYSASEMLCQLEKFFATVKERYGEVEITEQNGRFCLLLPPKAGEYIHQHRENYAFLQELIDLVAGHCHSFDEVLSVFHKYSDCVHVEPVNHGEFDYLIYFQDGKPDDFMYCISVEEKHITYHRFTKMDYESFGW